MSDSAIGLLLNCSVQSRIVLDGSLLQRLHLFGCVTRQQFAELPDFCLNTLASGNDALLAFLLHCKGLYLFSSPPQPLIFIS